MATLKIGKGITYNMDKLFNEVWKINPRLVLQRDMYNHKKNSFFIWEDIVTLSDALHIGPKSFMLVIPYQDFGDPEAYTDILQVDDKYIFGLTEDERKTLSEFITRRKDLAISQLQELKQIKHERRVERRRARRDVWRKKLQEEHSEDTDDEFVATSSSEE
jgi:hypothetical protein